MRHITRRMIGVSLACILLLSLLLFGCAQAVQPSFEQTPDPEPTDVPIELQTIEPTAAPEETPAPEQTATAEPTPIPEPARSGMARQLGL